jgi:hypothetical protein
MCTYCNTKNYRKIYEYHHGPIPQDEDGRSYDIHHIDGNHSNNEPTNLKALSIQDHYETHKSQGDVKACLIMSARMKIPYGEVVRLAKIANKGNNNPMYGKRGKLSPHYGKKRPLHSKMLTSRKRPDQSVKMLGNISRTGMTNSSESNEARRIACSGKNSPRYNTKDPMYQCVYCNRMVAGLGNFNRWHNNNCKSK